jgi:hypothetical protein
MHCDCEDRHRHGHHGHHHCGCEERHGGGCGCGGRHREPDHERGGEFRRRYHTQEERLAELEAYLADLKAEVQAVEERLAELRK